MITSKKITTKWNPTNKSYYINKGYNFSKMGNEFEVDIEDLYEGSCALVEVKCDFCNGEFLKPFNKLSYQEKHCCKKCKHKKYEDTCMKKYGVKNMFQDKKIKEKIKLTNLEKYGVENPYQMEKVKNKVKHNNIVNYDTEYAFLSDKAKQTNIEKYGVKYPTQSKEIQEKIKQTNLNRYNVEYPMQSVAVKEKTKINNLKKYGVTNPAKLSEIQDKIKLTNLKKYGVTHIMKDENIKKQIIQKSLNTMYNNQTGMSSSQQRYLCNVLNGELNYPVRTYQLDIAFPDDKLYLEYNGSGHDLSVKLGQISLKKFLIKELNRYYFLKENNWKFIKIESKNDALLQDDIFIKLIEKCKEYLKLNNWVEINIDDMKIIGKNYEEDISQYRKFKFYLK